MGEIMETDYELDYDVLEEEADRIRLQRLIDTGLAWRMEGAVGRAAMDAIRSGHCVLGKEPFTDYWGNRIPSRYEVEPGTKGSEEYSKMLGHHPIS
jgi:hypothetical protein